MTYRGRFLRRLRTEWAEKYEVVPLNDGIPDQAPRGRIDACATDADPASSTKDQEVGELGTEGAPLHFDEHKRLQHVTLH